MELKGVIVEGIGESHHLPYARRPALLDFPVSQVNGRNHAGFPGLGVVCDGLPYLSFLHDALKGAVVLATDGLPHLGQPLFPDDFLKIFHRRSLLLDESGRKKMTPAHWTEVIVSHPKGGAFMADFIAF